ncbi:Uncharacterised protein [Mycobacteroides abscessus subsp. abscessus]|nr:Uncharacterised protein [Mycobacteroides abscessus subsp. abscessus]
MRPAWGLHDQSFAPAGATSGFDRLCAKAAGNVVCFGPLPVGMSQRLSPLSRKVSARAGVGEASEMESASCCCGAADAVPTEFAASETHAAIAATAVVSRRVRERRRFDDVVTCEPLS